MKRRARLIPAVLAAVCLAACGPAVAAGPAAGPAAVRAGGAVPATGNDPTPGPGESAAVAAPSAGNPVIDSTGADSTGADSAGTYATDTSSAATAAAAGVIQTDVWIPAGDHRVPGTLALPVAQPGASPSGSVQPGGSTPVVLLLHGDLSSRDENGDLFGHLASALAARGIASLRIDFAGSGGSEQPDLALDYPGMVADATAAVRFLQDRAGLDPGRIAVLGLSRGGSIAATVAGTVPGIAAFVSWSGAVANGSDEDPDAHQIARDDGSYPVDLGDREFRLSLAWYDSIEAARPLDDVAGYTGPVLAIVGTGDEVVPPEESTALIATVASKDATLHTIDGADHGFSHDPGYSDEAIAVTTDWLALRFIG